MKLWLKLGVLFLCLLSFSTSYAWRQLTITKNDSLAITAEKYRPSGVARMDMVIAIRNANPSLFAKASNFKPGATLLLPTTQDEVRQAIKGKAPLISTASRHDVTSSSKHKAATPTATKTPKKVVKTASKPSNSAVAATKAVAPRVKPVQAKRGATNSTTAAQSATLVKSLEDTVSNQTQMIQSYQAQINQLNAQLNLANAQVQSLQAQGGTSGLWTLANLWLALWVLTLAALAWQYRNYRNLKTPMSEIADTESDHSLLEPHYEAASVADDATDGDEEDEAAEDSIEQDNYAEEEDGDDQADEEDVVEENEEDDALDEDEYEPKEPQIHSGQEEKPKSLSANWEQVELDIPDIDMSDTNSDLLLDKHQDRALSEGEQQVDIIDVLAGDETNMEWHRALLEFYVKTNSQNGFKRHYQSMIQNGLIMEGDPLWEDVRKMYLNKWIYQTI